MKFQDLETITPRDVDLALQRDDPEELQFVSLTLALSDLDCALVQSVCIRLCSSRDSKVRSYALISLGHLARRYRDLDEGSVKPLIEAALQDRDDLVRTFAKSAADEIHQFIHWTINGHTYG